MAPEKAPSLKNTSPNKPSSKPQLTDLKSTIIQQTAMVEQKKQTHTTHQWLDALASSIKPATHQSWGVWATSTSSQAHATLAPKDTILLPWKAGASVITTLTPTSDPTRTPPSKAPDLTKTMDDALRQAFFYEEFVKAGLTTTDFGDIMALMDEDWKGICDFWGGWHRLTQLAQIIKAMRHKRILEAQVNAIAYEQHKKKRVLDERKDALGMILGEMVEENPAWIEKFLADPSSMMQFLTDHWPKLTQLLSTYPSLPNQTKEQLWAVLDLILLALINGIFLEIYEIQIWNDGALIINGSPMTIKLPVQAALSDEENDYHTKLAASWTTLCSRHSF